MKHIQRFNENSEIEDKVSIIRVKDLITYLKGFDPETEVVLSSTYTKGETAHERLESSHWIHRRTDGKVVIDGLK